MDINLSVLTLHEVDRTGRTSELYFLASSLSLALMAKAKQESWIFFYFVLKFCGCRLCYHLLFPGLFIYH